MFTTWTPAFAGVTEEFMFIKERILVFLFPLLLSLPFINRAYFVDDNYFVEIAEWLKDNPSQPYHFRADDAGLQNRGWEEDGFVRMVNPLLHHYYMAALIKVGGSKEWFLRLGTLLLSCFGALFLFGLARRWTNHPLLSTLLILVTPVYWLSAHSLLIDSTMGFFFFGALYFFIRATERPDIRALILSGLFMGLAILTKYTALLIIPLTGLWWVLKWKKLENRWVFTIPWIMGLSFLLIWSLYTQQLYGSMHIIAASHRMVKVFGWPKIFVFLVFLSGSSLIPLLAWGAISKRRIVFNAVFVFLLAGVFSSAVGGFSIEQSFLLALWFITSLILPASFISHYPKWIYPRDHFIMGWFLGFIAMMIIVMGWVAVRYYVIVIPAIGFISIRLIEMNWPKRARSIQKITLGVMLLVSGALAFADYNQANPSRDLVQKLREEGYSGGPRHFYLGDSFTMSYLKDEGWIPCFPDTVFQVGDQVMMKEVTMPLKWFAKKPIKIKHKAIFTYPTWFPIKVMDYHGSAGFYASVWGALPFTLSTGPWEQFRIVEVVEVLDE